MTILTNSNDLVRATPVTWQQHLKRAVRSASALAQALDLPVNSICGQQSEGNFPLFVPQPYLDRIKKGDLKDPLLLQVLPTEAESKLVSGFTSDPLQEEEFHRDAGLLHKYPGRALLVVNGTCAVHCRYCFRRHFPYSLTTDETGRWQSAIQRITEDRSIREIILSGGDPLTLVDEQLGQLVDRLSAIPHLRRIRLHTRLPIVIPSRITEPLLELLGSTPLQVVVVVYCNHAQEINAEVAGACQSLADACHSILNQSVLLRGVNDDVDALVELSERLYSMSVLPYYLHQLDRVQGAAHFEVSRQRGAELIEKMRSQLPGYLVPRYVREEPGQTSKTVIS